MIEVHTATGSVYLVDRVKKRVHRSAVGSSRGMRGDGEWKRLNVVPRIEVGTPMVLFMEPLGEGDVTIRTTSAVKRIEEDK